MNDDFCNVQITNPNKILFEKGKITKLDVVSFYADIANRMLPFTKSRLLSVIRCHQSGEKFFKKHPTTDKHFVEVFQDGENEFFYIKNHFQLVMQVQLGSVEFHTWGSSVPKIDQPNLMVFDLDPNDDVSLQKLRNCVLDLKNLLDDLGLKSFLKTSGGKGYHIVLPLKTFKNWEDFSQFSKKVATVLENKFPNRFTTNIRKIERKGKIFIDYLRNNKGATCVAPYSLRARDNAPISFPLKWENLNEIKPNEVTIKNYHKYLEKTSPWQNFDTENQKTKT